LIANKKTDRRIKQPPTDAIKRPHIHQQREAVRQRDEDDGVAAHAVCRTPGGGRAARGHEVTSVGEEEEEEGPDEFANRCDQVSLHGGERDTSPLPFDVACVAVDFDLWGHFGGRVGVEEIGRGGIW